MRIPRLVPCALLAVFFCVAVYAQDVPDGSTLHSTTTLVLVPTLVRDAHGELISNLTAKDFRLTDNGVEQTVTADHLERQPLAVVVLLQTGATAPRQFPCYRDVGIMLQYMMGESPHKVGLITFDSQPEEIWDFPVRDDGLNYAFAHPQPGDGGAALLDAVGYAIDVLKRQPDTYRRIILLLSQTNDAGSKARPEEIVQRLGESNTTIYSVTFSPGKTWLKDQFTKPRHGNPPYQLSPNQPAVLGTFDLGTPLGVALSAMRADTAGGIASLSGGENLQFMDKNDLERQLSLLANHIPNRYTLSFRPSSSEPGLHRLQVQVLHQPAATTVAARTGYWAK
jgi:VWFA-related protein